MPLVATRLGNDNYLCSRPLAVLCSVGIAQHIELADRFHTDQILTCSTRLHVVFRSACELDTVEQEQILLRTIPRHCEIVAGG